MIVFSKLTDHLDLDIVPLRTPILCQGICPCLVTRRRIKVKRKTFKMSVSNLCNGSKAGDNTDQETIRSMRVRQTNWPGIRNGGATSTSKYLCHQPQVPCKGALGPLAFPKKCTQCKCKAMDTGMPYKHERSSHPYFHLKGDEIGSLVKIFIWGTLSHPL